MSAQDKAALRGQMRALRRALSAQEQAACARAAFARLTGFAPYRRAGSVMAYAAARGELPLDAVLDDLLAGGRTLLMPRCEGPGRMTARRVTSLSQLRPGAYGLMEPEEGCPAAAPEEIGLVLVPGTAFDRSGGRLGQGGGYYDRFLARTRALTVGVCHDFALIARVPAEAHDARMDYILTPGALLACREHPQEDRRV